MTAMIAAALGVLGTVVAMKRDTLMGRINKDAADDRQQHEVELSKQRFVSDVIQSTLQKGTVDEQIKNLKAYVEIGVIGEPYASKIRNMNDDDLPRARANILEEVQNSEGALLPVSYFETLTRATRAVGLVRANGAESAPTGLTTGFLIGGGLLLSVDYALPGPAVAEASDLWMGYQQDQDGAPAIPDTFRLDPSKFWLSNPAIGYVIVAVAAKSDAGTMISNYGSVGLSRADQSITKGERINIIHHAGGGPKMVSMRGGEVLDTDRAYLRYTAATGPGAGGAPVFNDRFEVLAIHRQRVSDQGDEMTETLAAQTPRWTGLEGVRTRDILADLQDHCDNPGQSGLSAQAVKRLKTAIAG